MENVAPMRPKDQPRREVPAIGASITCNLGGDRQMVIQTHVAGDDTDEQVKGTLDRMLSFVDRAKARYEMEQEEEQFRTVGVTLANLIAGFPHAERMFAKEQVERDAQIELLQADIKKNHDEAYNRHVESGRRGAFTLKGASAQVQDRLEKEIAMVHERGIKALKDREQHRQQLIQSVLNYQQDLKKRRAKLNAKRLLTGQPPMEEYLDVENAEIERL